MAIQISISNAIGSRYRGSVVPPVDPDAQAFITAASITDPTQQSAINQLVVDLKGYGVWTKMKALYPFVGGTAAQHKWNLKDPRDLDAAFRLVFSGGWTHSANGALPNGTNAFADSKYNLSTNSTTSNVSGGFYSRTNVVNGGATFGALNPSNAGLAVTIKNNDQNTYWAVNDSVLTGVGNFVTDTRGLFVLNKVSLTEKRIYRNGSQISTFTPSSNTAPSINVYYGARNNNGTAGQYDTRELAFGFLGDTLTNTEVSNFYTAVQAFQTTLGRSIGTQSVSDADAQAFVTNAGIVDQVEANAVNNLVIGLKADGLWTKMKACYPMVGGSSSTMKYNLKNPLDTDAAFRLVFNGGWTFSSNGATPNGTNAFADTKCNISTQISNTSHAFGIYSRTNNTSGTQVYGVFGSPDLLVQHNLSNGNFVSGKTPNNTISYTANPSTSLLMSTRRSSTDFQAYRAGVSLGTDTNLASSFPSFNFYLSARNDNGSANLYTNHQLAFAFLSDGLTNTESGNFYTAVQTFQTALNRNV